MGGNALLHAKKLVGKEWVPNPVETRRADAEEYFLLEAEVLAQLLVDFPDRRAEAVRAYKTKPSFGDMDVLFESDNFPEDPQEYVKRAFNPTAVVSNGSVVSFDYKMFQVDLILTPSKEFETSATYFAWNDLGNFMGRVSHKMGFKYGHQGLTQVFRFGNYHFADVVVSRDVRKIFEFLDYDYDRFMAGFDTLEDVFKFATTSKFFNKNAYLLENRNHKSRVRDKKRKSYNEFLSWLEVTDVENEYPWANLRDHGGTEYKKEFVERAFEFFPGYREVHDETLRHYDNAKLAKGLFSGEVVRQLTNLEGKELGFFMQHTRKLFGEMSADEFNVKMLSLGAEGVKAMVLEEFSKWEPRSTE